MTVIENVYALPHLAAVLISGADAENFLQSQLSSNVAALDANTVQLSSWCAANGRVIGLGWLYRSGADYYWIVAADTAEVIVLGLNKYRFRAKVSITQATADTVVIGSDTQQVGVQLAHGRSIGCAAKSSVAEVDAQFLARWLQRDIELKIPWNGGGERFLPQMLGLERFAGLSLKKGCFPGQEVISRLHYKGLLKRSLRVLQIEQPPDSPTPALGRYLCNDAQDEVEIIQAQGISTLAVVGHNLPRDFTIEREDRTLSSHSIDIECE